MTLEIDNRRQQGYTVIFDNITTREKNVQSVWGVVLINLNSDSLNKLNDPHTIPLFLYIFNNIYFHLNPSDLKKSYLIKIWHFKNSFQYIRLMVYIAQMARGFHWHNKTCHFMISQRRYYQAK